MAHSLAALQGFLSVAIGLGAALSLNPSTSTMHPASDCVEHQAVDQNSKSAVEEGAQKKIVSTLSKTFVIPSDVARSVREFVLLSEIGAIAILQQDSDRYLIRVLEIESGKLSDPIGTVTGLRIDAPPLLQAGGDGRSVLVRAAYGEPLYVYDVKEKKLRFTLPPEAATLPFNNPTFIGNEIVTFRPPDQLQRWSSSDGKSLGDIRVRLDSPVSTIVPVGNTATEIILLAVADIEKDTGKALRVNVATGDIVGRVEGLPNGPLATVGSGSAFAIGRIKSNEWNEIELVRVPELTRHTSTRLSSRIASMQQAISKDGRRLSALDWMTGEIVTWDTTSGGLLFRVSPSIGGCLKFSMSPDGATILAFTGAMEDGSLRPSQFELYTVK
ncbi:MAG: hypothetical protein JNM94_05165 [Phycisphaerae bacterium]|nr:hypothetical protein [Phycisphaerae bacterium]